MNVQPNNNGKLQRNGGPGQPLVREGKREANEGRGEPLVGEGRPQRDGFDAMGYSITSDDSRSTRVGKPTTTKDTPAAPYPSDASQRNLDATGINADVHRFDEDKAEPIPPPLRMEEGENIDDMHEINPLVKSESEDTEDDQPSHALWKRARSSKARKAALLKSLRNALNEGRFGADLQHLVKGTKTGEQAMAALRKLADQLEAEANPRGAIQRDENGQRPGGKDAPGFEMEDVPNKLPPVRGQGPNGSCAADLPSMLSPALKALEASANRYQGNIKPSATARVDWGRGKAK